MALTALAVVALIEAVVSPAQGKAGVALFLFLALTFVWSLWSLLCLAVDRVLPGRRAAIGGTAEPPTMVAVLVRDDVDAGDGNDVGRQINETFNPAIVRLIEDTNHLYPRDPDEGR